MKIEQDVLDYDENYLDEAGFGYETDITNELQPERIAAIILVTKSFKNRMRQENCNNSGYEISALEGSGL